MGIDNRYGAVQRLLLLTYPSACWKLSLHLFQFIDKLFWFLQTIARPGEKLRNLRLAQWLEAGHEVAILEDCNYCSRLLLRLQYCSTCYTISTLTLNQIQRSKQVH